MYARQSPTGRYTQELNIPKNYSGNAFRQEHIMPDLPPEELYEEEQKIHTEEKNAEPVSHAPEVLAASKGLFKSGGGGIGLEELLILGLCFLVSQNDSKDDLALLLLMLLFVQ